MLQRENPLRGRTRDSRWDPSTPYGLRFVAGRTAQDDSA